jgi:threonine aldolase
VLPAPGGGWVVIVEYGGQACRVALDTRAEADAVAAVLAAKGAHIDLDEAGAPEHITGSKIETIATPDGRLTPELLEGALRSREQHPVVQRVVSITQSTECGTAYTPAAVAPSSDSNATPRMRH